MSEENWHFLMRFLTRLGEDKRLNTSHISLCFALIVCWNDQKHKSPFKISRRILMNYGKIASISTYHICIKDLISFGLIVYSPSYDYYQGTLVSLLLK
jgi:hypothetical protein